MHVSKKLGREQWNVRNVKKKVALRRNSWTNILKLYTYKKNILEKQNFSEVNMSIDSLINLKLRLQILE